MAGRGGRVLTATRRGDVILIAGGGDYAAKPRPAVVVQADGFPETGSVALCLVTSHDSGAPLVRLPVRPDATNGLEKASWIMVDKLTALPRTKLRGAIGQLSREDQSRLDRALVVFLGIG